MRPFLTGSGQCIDPPVRFGPAGIVHLTVVPEGAVVDLVETIDAQHQFFGRVPGVHQDGMKWQLLVLYQLRKHVPRMIEFALAIPVGIVDAVIDHPVLARLGMDVHTVDQPDALDQTMRIAAVLQPHQCDLVREILI